MNKMHPTAPQKKNSSDEQMETRNVLQVCGYFEGREREREKKPILNNCITDDNEFRSGRHTAIKFSHQ